MDHQENLSPSTPNTPTWPTPPTITPSPKPTSADGVFIGRFGLRAGWGIAIFLPLFVLIIVISSLAIMAAQGKLKPLIAQSMANAQAQKNHTAPPAVAPAPKPTNEPAIMKAKSSFINESLQFGALAFVTLILSKIERRRMAVFGLGKYNFGQIVPGALIGLISLSVLVGILHLGHFLAFDYLAIHGIDILLYAVKWSLVFLFVGFFEEYLFRGYLQYTLMRGLYGLGEKISLPHARAIAFWLASSILSGLFALTHLGNSGENGMGICMVFLAGVVFSYALWKTGSLWWAIGFHWTWDWAQSFLYGVPDSGNLSVGRLLQTHPTGKLLLSGGIDGPEGSVFVIPVLLLVMVVIYFTRAGAQPPLEPLPPVVETPSESQPLIA
jgi:uncharacterized protein